MVSVKKIYFFFSLFIFSVCFSQSADLSKLESEVFALNKKGDYKVSQQKVIDFLKRRSLSSSDEAKLYVLLSATYRSLLDYPTAIDYLLQAQSIGTYLQPNDSVVSEINSQLAYLYFDSNQYDKCAKIMQIIEKNKYINISPVDKAYLTMQQGYLQFLENNYELAAKKYNEALKILQKASPCDTPVILVKEMQLYGKQQNLSEAENFYQKSIKISDSCKILKYKLYATEELVTVYQQNKAYEKADHYSKVAQDLRKQFDREGKVFDLHEESMKYVEEEEKDFEQFNLIKTIIYIISLILFLLLVYYFYKKSSYHKREKEKLDAELSQMKKELKVFSEYQFTHQNSAKEADVLNFEKLNDRQKELLKYMTEGFSNKEIAEKLFITEATVKYHIKNIYEILELKNRKDFFAKISKKQ